MRWTLRAVGLLAASFTTLPGAQEAPPPSAKALFMADASTGTEVTVQKDQRKVAVSQPKQSAPGASSVASVSPSHKPEGDYAGLSYWVELRTPAGQQLWVNSSRVFHSGDRIRLHLTSRVDGDLTILQSQNGTSFAKLYPARATASPLVERGKEITLPWFRFDNQPGDIRLLVAIQGRPTQPGAASPLSVASASSPARMSPEEDRKLFERMQAQVVRQRGSKALLVEEDDSAEKPATYVVAPTSAGRDAGFLVTEIRLAHR